MQHPTMYVIQDLDTGEFYLRSYSPKTGLFGADLTIANLYRSEVTATRDLNLANYQREPQRNLQVSKVHLILG